MATKETWILVGAICMQHIMRLSILNINEEKKSQEWTTLTEKSLPRNEQYQ